jgi:heterodisulfide reductase subunit B
MNKQNRIDVSYFPGCSLESTAVENNLSLLNLFDRLGFNLIELDDWNCCGSSSAHSIDGEAAFHLGTRNLSLAPAGRPLVVACPSCLLRLRETQLKLRSDENARRAYEELWGRAVDPNLEILHFFELLHGKDLLSYSENREKKLQGLRFVSYYGCMLNRPPALRHEEKYHGLMEKILASLGAEPLSWPYLSRCCGTFLSVARPNVVTEMVNEINRGAKDIGADCIVTACAMCHLNLEVRCTLKPKIPTLHFTEILSLALGNTEHKGWFSRHLVDPRPLLRSRGLI